MQFAWGFLFKLILATSYSPTDTLRSTIGEGGLNCRVRHGTGCVPSSVTTRNLYVLWLRALLFLLRVSRSPALEVLLYSLARLTSKHLRKLTNLFA